MEQTAVRAKRRRKGGDGMATEQDRVVILDTTLRDGEQTPGINLNLVEKLEIARQLDRLGVDYIEAGFPASSPGDFEAARAVSQSVDCGVAALCRCVPGDIQKGWEAVKYAKRPRLHLFIATSDLHMEVKLKMNREEVLARAVESVRLARSLCDDVQFSCEDGSRSDPVFLCQILEAVIEAGAGTICIADTVGYAMPEEFGGLIREITQTVKGIETVRLSAHCHNDLGLAVANTLSAIQNGARQVEATINGIGERAGNCPLEEVVMALTVRKNRYGLEHGIDTRRISRSSRQVAKLTGIPIGVTKPIVGANAFAHESGIHQHGVLQNPMTYEIMTPQSVGKRGSKMVLGKHSGRHAFGEHLEDMGYALSPKELDRAFEDFKLLTNRKTSITDRDLEAMIQHRMVDVPDFYRIEAFQVQSNNRMQAMASITLAHNEETVTEAATGEGPVDAACNAIARIVGGEWPLISYDIKAVTGGVDALGEVTVRVRYRGELHLGRGLSTDIIEASVRAYINAINRALAWESKLSS